MNTLRPFFAATGLALLASACTTPRLAVPRPLPPVTPSAQGEVAFQADTGNKPREGLTVGSTPAIPDSGASAVAGAEGEPMPPLKGGAVNVNIEGMPIPAFVNEFFGSILGVGFQMDPQVSKMNDLVTLRTAGPQTPKDFYRLAVQVLRNYGVAVEYSSGLVFFSRAKENSGLVPPLVVSGRALPAVPISHRPVFQLVELQSVRVNDVTSLLTSAFKTSDALNIQPDNSRNAIILMGRPEMVRQALEAIKVFDRPFMRGRTSARLEPAFVTADELSKRLVEVLSAEGYGAGLYTAGGAGTAILVLPVTAANTVLVFAADRKVLDHTIAWAREIDKPNPTAGTDGLFYYMVKNTRAEEIVKTITGVRNSSSSSKSGSRGAIDGSQVGQAATAAAAAEQGGSKTSGDLAEGKLTLDEPRNAIIFQGSAPEWGRLLQLIQQMDRAPRQVMIEVTVAEVTLTDDQQFGVAWLAHNAGLGRFNGNISSGKLNSTTGGASGLSYVLDIGGEARASLTAMASQDRITVLSTPRLMVKSGEEANIDVGTEVPTITAQATSGIQTGGNSGIIQSIQYRKTGILLGIKPVVYSDDRVDIELRQEVSEALPVGTDAAVSSPAIFNRSITTSLNLKDGAAILIGGLMSQRHTVGDSGVPYLKDVPLLGNLFKTQKRGRNRTEMVLMIVPYILESDSQTEELTRSLSQRFEMLDLSPVTSEPQLLPATPAATTTPAQ